MKYMSVDGHGVFWLPAQNCDKTGTAVQNLRVARRPTDRPTGSLSAEVLTEGLQKHERLTQQMQVAASTTATQSEVIGYTPITPNTRRKKPT